MQYQVAYLYILSYSWFQVYFNFSSVVTPPFTHNIDGIIKSTIADMDIQSPHEFYDFVSLNVTPDMLLLLGLLKKPALKKYRLLRFCSMLLQQLQIFQKYKSKDLSNLWDLHFYWKRLLLQELLILSHIFVFEKGTVPR